MHTDIKLTHLYILTNLFIAGNYTLISHTMITTYMTAVEALNNNRLKKVIMRWKMIIP